MAHFIHTVVGFGNNDALPELRRHLAWWVKRPKQATSPRGQQRIATLQRQIASLEAEAATFDSAAGR